MNKAFEILRTLEGVGSLSLSFLAIVCCFITGKSIFLHKKPMYFIIIPIYFSLLIFQLLYCDYYFFFSNIKTTGKGNPGNQSLVIYIILEYIVFSILLSKSIKLSFLKMYLPLSSIFFFAFVTYAWYYINPWNDFLASITVVESIIIIFSCLYYFYETIKKPAISHLNKEPFFWITTGILFLFIWITPLYLAYKAVANFPELQIIDYLAYAAIIIMFTKAVLCSFQPAT
jgi:hypothetical protein